MTDKAASSMSILDILRKKRDGGQLTSDEIAFVVKGATDGTIPDYQLSAFLMAACTRGFSLDETIALTKHMAFSGSTLKVTLSPESGRKVRVDKHSTGGVGDKVTMILAPILACFPSIAIAKLSGRSLGYTGGTIDKLESIPGFRTDLSKQEIENMVNRLGLSVSAATADLAPADHILYKLRDVTGTVESQHLICASVLSKKIAASADVILLDVKYGAGAFMKDYESARGLGLLMTQVGKALGVRICIVLSDMNEPLGNCVGNALEIQECIEALRDEGPSDLSFICVELAALMLVEAGVYLSIEEARKEVQLAITSGRALAKFKDWVRAQGGDLESFAAQSSKVAHTVVAKTHGWVAAIDADRVSRLVFALGSGRSQLSSSINPTVGVRLLKKHGSQVKDGEAIAVIRASSFQDAEKAERELLQAYRLVEHPDQVPPRQLIREVFSSNGTVRPRL